MSIKKVGTETQLLFTGWRRYPHFSLEGGGGIHIPTQEDGGGIPTSLWKVGVASTSQLKNMEVASPLFWEGGGGIHISLQKIWRQHPHFSSEFDLHIFQSFPQDFTDVLKDVIDSLEGVIGSFRMLYIPFDSS